MSNLVQDTDRDDVDLNFGHRFDTGGNGAVNARLAYFGLARPSPARPKVDYPNSWKVLRGAALRTHRLDRVGHEGSLNDRHLSICPMFEAHTV